MLTGASLDISTSCFWYPTTETTSVTGNGAVVEREKLPSAPEVVPVSFPFTMIDAPTMAALVSTSATEPEMFVCCANNFELQQQGKRMNIASKSFFIVDC